MSNSARRMRASPPGGLSQPSVGWKRLMRLRVRRGSRTHEARGVDPRGRLGHERRSTASDKRTRPRLTSRERRRDTSDELSTRPRGAPAARALRRGRVRVCRAVHRAADPRARWSRSSRPSLPCCSSLGIVWFALRRLAGGGARRSARPRGGRDAAVPRSLGLRPGRARVRRAAAGRVGPAPAAGQRRLRGAVRPHPLGRRARPLRGRAAAARGRRVLLLQRTPAAERVPGWPSGSARPADGWRRRSCVQAVLLGLAAFAAARALGLRRGLAPALAFFGLVLGLTGDTCPPRRPSRSA